MEIVAKKNTLLYLDEKLVKLAKKLDLNISQITEMALVAFHLVCDMREYAEAFITSRS